MRSHNIRGALNKIFLYKKKRNGVCLLNYFHRIDALLYTLAALGIIQSFEYTADPQVVKVFIRPEYRPLYKSAKSRKGWRRLSLERLCSLQYKDPSSMHLVAGSSGVRDLTEFRQGGH